MKSMNPANAKPIRPSRRNPLATLLLPTLLILAAPPLGNFLGQTMFRLAPTIALGMGVLLMFFSLQRMAAELNSVTGGKLVGWHFFIPFYGFYWAFAILPKEMAVAKQKAGKPAACSPVVYLFFCLYAFAADLNDLS